jgi:DNA-binding NarL/FixJ family response regulator
MADDLIRVVVVDDHQLFREGLVALLASADGIEVVGTAGSGDEALEVLAATAPDVVLMDIAMPGKSGIETTHRLLERRPDVHVVMLTMLEDDDSLFAALRAGAHGYLLKGADSAEVLRTLRSVAAGEAVVGPGMAQRLTALFQTHRSSGASLAPFPELTDREREVLELIAAGHDNRTIAAQLHISVKTVANNVSAILVKLHLRDRAHAVATARDAGLGTGSHPHRGRPDTGITANTTDRREPRR